MSIHSLVLGFFLTYDSFSYDRFFVYTVDTHFHLLACQSIINQIKDQSVHTSRITSNKEAGSEYSFTTMSRLGPCDSRPIKL
jgi:hypothetical protein